MGLAHACAEGAALRGWRLRAVEWFDYLDFVAEPLPFDEGVWHPPPNTGFDVKQSPGCFFVAVVRRLRPVFLLGCVLHHGTGQLAWLCFLHSAFVGRLLTAGTRLS